MPKVSVIIPNYNHAGFLTRRLDSVLQQSFQDLELILLDDASTDNSATILRQYAERDPGRIRFVPNEQNSGSTFRQWNKGFKLVSGEFVWIAESDDFADPHLLKRLVDMLQANPSCVIAYCQSSIVDASDAVIGQGYDYTADLDKSLWHRDFVLNGMEACRRFFTVKNVIPNASAVLIRRSAIDQIKSADESLRLAGDWKFWVDLLQFGDLAYVAEPLNYFRKHRSTVRASSGRSGLELIESAKMVRYTARLSGADARAIDLGLEAAAMNWLSSLAANGWPIAVAGKSFFQGWRVDAKLPWRTAGRVARYLAKRLPSRNRSYSAT